MRRSLIGLGLALLALGLAWPLVRRLRLGRLPGDIVIHRPGFAFYFPLTTTILLSIVLSLILWLLRR